MTVDCRHLFWLLATILMLAASCDAADWPQFQRDSTKSGLADGSVPTKPAIVWSADLKSVDVPPIISSGAVYVARWTALHIRRLTNSITEALNKKGFKCIEVISPCAMYYSRTNKLGDGLDMMEFYHDNSEVRNGEDTRNLDLGFQTKITVGKFVDRERPTYTDLYNNWLSEIRDKES